RERPDHLPQQVGRRRQHRLLERLARNRHNVNSGHFASPSSHFASRRIARWPPGVTPTRRTRAQQSQWDQSPHTPHPWTLTVRNDASNRVTGARPAHKRLLAYLEWAGNSANMLRFQIGEADVATLVLIRRYEVLLSSFGTMASSEMEVQRVVNDLVTLEI